MSVYPLHICRPAHSAVAQFEVHEVTGNVASLLRAELKLHLLCLCFETLKNGLVKSVCCVWELIIGSLVKRKLRGTRCAVYSRLMTRLLCVAAALFEGFAARRFGTVFTCCRLVRLLFARSLCCRLKRASIL
jgi:hypothetical protein